MNLLKLIVFNFMLFFVTICAQAGGADLISTFAGDGEDFSDDKGFFGNYLPPYNVDATSVSVAPRYIVTDLNGNLYVSEPTRLMVNRITVDRISHKGTLSYFAGNGKKAWSSTDINLGGNAVDASFETLGDVAVDGLGNVYIIDTAWNQIRRVGPDGIIMAFAGRRQGGSMILIASGDGEPATEAYLQRPRGIATDVQGNLYIADGPRVRRVDTDGIITTIAGTGSEFIYSTNYERDRHQGDGGPAIEATMTADDIAIDALGNLYIAGNNRIRRIGQDGIITAFAGSGAAELTEPGFFGDDGPATQARFNNLTHVTVDGKGNVYIADEGNKRVRRVDSKGIITTVAGSGETGFLRNFTPAIEAPISILDITVDNNDNLYIADNAKLLWVAMNAPGIDVGIDRLDYDISSTPDTHFFTIQNPGSGNLSIGSLAIENADSVHFSIAIEDVNTAFDDPNVIHYATDLDTMIIGPGASRSVRVFFQPQSTGQILTTLIVRNNAINGEPVHIPINGFAPPVVQVSDSLLTVPKTSVTFTSWDTIKVKNLTTFRAFNIKDMHLEGPDIDQFQASFINASNLKNPRVGPTEERSIEIAFTPTSAGYKTATLNIRHDSYDAPIKVILSGRAAPKDALYITTIAGAAFFGNFSGDFGDAIEASVNKPTAIASDIRGSIYIADQGNNRIRQIDTNGIITTFAGGRTVPDGLGDGSLANRAQLSKPADVAVDIHGNIFIADFDNQRIRKVNTERIISTVAGSGAAKNEGFFTGDGSPATQAELNGPIAIAVDALGNIFIADTFNHRIRKVDSQGVITTTAGSGSVGFQGGGFSGDTGLATQALLRFPTGLAVDQDGSIYISDSQNDRVRKVTPDGIINTVAGGGTAGENPYGDSGQAINATLDNPQKLFWHQNKLYIADAGHHRIRVVDQDGMISTVAGDSTSGFSGDNGPAIFATLRSPNGIAKDPDGFIYIADTDNNRIRKLYSPKGQTTTRLSTDFDGSGTVDFPDFLFFISKFGKSTTDSGFDDRADLDHNGTVAFPDFLMFAQTFGSTSND